MFFASLWKFQDSTDIFSSPETISSATVQFTKRSSGYFSFLLQYFLISGITFQFFLRISISAYISNLFLYAVYFIPKSP